MTENSKILEKIKKCLALAGSSNPHEAETAWRQARKLMETHKLEMLDVQAASVNTTSSYAGKRPPVWLLPLVQACAKAFSCNVITPDEFCWYGNSNKYRTSDLDFFIKKSGSEDVFSSRVIGIRFSITSSMPAYIF